MCLFCLCAPSCTRIPFFKLFLLPFLKHSTGSFSYRTRSNTVADLSSLQSASDDMGSRVSQATSAASAAADAADAAKHEASTASEKTASLTTKMKVSLVCVLARVHAHWCPTLTSSFCLVSLRPERKGQIQSRPPAPVGVGGEGPRHKGCGSVEPRMGCTDGFRVQVETTPCGKAYKACRDRGHGDLRMCIQALGCMRRPVCNTQTGCRR